MTFKEFEIFKYFSFDIAQKVICEQKLKFNNPSFFNDPFDCDLDLISFELKNFSSDVKMEIAQLRSENKQHQLSDELLLKAYRHAQLNKLYKASICCFSLDFKNTVMWSHYGDNHNGVALIFDQSLDDCFEDLESERISLFPVCYSRTSRTNYLENKVKAIQELFATKSEDWKYESEYRLVTLKNQEFFKFRKQYLTGAIFGCRVNSTDRETFIKFCKRHGYGDLKYGYLEKANLKIELKEIKTQHNN